MSKAVFLSLLVLGSVSVSPSVQADPQDTVEDVEWILDRTREYVEDFNATDDPEAQVAKTDAYLNDLESGGRVVGFCGFDPGEPRLKIMGTFFPKFRLNIGVPGAGIDTDGNPSLGTIYLTIGERDQGVCGGAILPGGS